MRTCSQRNINWMLHDATVTIQAIRPYCLGMFSGDLLEGSNRVLKDIWSSFCDRGGGAWDAAF